jgi:hypothetical protein
MPKINIKITLKTKEQTIENKYKAIFHPETNIIIYQEEDKTKTQFDLRNLRLRRENENLWLEYLFNEQEKTKGIIKIKELNQNLQVNIQTQKINQQNKNIEIEYQLEEESYKYKLEVIE